MPKRKPIFMIHQHHASRLHFDFRLEIDGKLKSWALRELPLKPSKGTLAVQVPDHPFWYRHFEGVLPEGTYGAGPVMVWDKGLYTSFTTDHTGKVLPLSECEKNGLILVWLEGQKLKGGYILARVTKKQKWVLIKMDDEFVIHGRKPNTWNKSIKSGKTLEEIFNKKSKKITYKKWLATGANIRYRKKNKNL